MKVNIQTMANKKFSVEIDEKETVMALKQKIQSEHNLGDVEKQKLIHIGKILQNEQTIESANVKPGDMIVLMYTGASSATASAPAPATAAAPRAQPSATSAAAAAPPSQILDRISKQASHAATMSSTSTSSSPLVVSKANVSVLTDPYGCLPWFKRNDTRAAVRRLVKTRKGGEVFTIDDTAVDSILLPLQRLTLHVLSKLGRDVDIPTLIFHSVAITTGPMQLLVSVKAGRAGRMVKAKEKEVKDDLADTESDDVSPAASDDQPVLTAIGLPWRTLPGLSASKEKSLSLPLRGALGEILHQVCHQFVTEVVSFARKQQEVANANAAGRNVIDAKLVRVAIQGLVPSSVANNPITEFDGAESTSTTASSEEEDEAASLPYLICRLSLLDEFELSSNLLWCRQAWIREILSDGAKNNPLELEKFIEQIWTAQTKAKPKRNRRNEDEDEEADGEEEEEAQSKTFADVYDTAAIALQRHLLQKYAWFRHSDEISKILPQWLEGQLTAEPQLDCMKVPRNCLRPVLYFGRSVCPKWSQIDEWVGRAGDPGEGASDDDYGSDEGFGAEDAALDRIAFDIIDAEGRSYPLLIEYRHDCNPDAPAYCAYGSLLDRRTFRELARMASSDQDVSSMYFHTLEAVSVFRNWSLHTDQDLVTLLDDPWEAYGELRPDAQQPKDWETAWDQYQPYPSNTASIKMQPLYSTSTGTTPIASKGASEASRVYSQVQQLIGAAAKLIQWDSEPESLTLFTAFHPIEVRREFTLAALKQKSQLDSVLPPELISLISDYALVDLPYVPLNPKLGNAAIESATAKMQQGDCEDAGEVGADRFLDLDGRPVNWRTFHSLIID